MPSAAWSLASAHEREALAARALETDAARQFARCFVPNEVPVSSLRAGARLELASDHPIDPNETHSWISSDGHACAVLRRHGVMDVSPARLALRAVGQLIAGKVERDRAAGLDWSRVARPASVLDEQLGAAHARLPIVLGLALLWKERAISTMRLGPGIRRTKRICDA